MEILPNDKIITQYNDNDFLIYRVKVYYHAENKEYMGYEKFIIRRPEIVSEEVYARFI